jgi:hypothetical protein
MGNSKKLRKALIGKINGTTITNTRSPSSINIFHKYNSLKKLFLENIFTFKSIKQKIILIIFTNYYRLASSSKKNIKLDLLLSTHQLSIFPPFFHKRTKINQPGNFSKPITDLLIQQKNTKLVLLSSTHQLTKIIFLKNK